MLITLSRMAIISDMIPNNLFVLGRLKNINCIEIVLISSGGDVLYKFYKL